MVSTLALSLATAAAAQSPAVPSRIVEPVRAADTVTLKGNTHPWTRGALDLGLVSGAQQLGRMFIALQRSPEQERALAAFNGRQYDPRSADYHRWLQPAEFGLAYGPSDADIAAIEGWLESSGLRILTTAKGRISIEFTGTAEAVQSAFHVEMHRYVVNGKVQLSNDRDPAIPRALSPVIGGISGLNDFPLDEPRRPGSYAKLDHATGRLSPYTPASPELAPSRALAAGSPAQNPQFTFTEGTTSLAYVTPYDFATIYNSLPLWNATVPIVGSGETIAVVGDNDVNLKDISTFRAAFGLPANTPTITYVGTDPKGSSEENTLDLEMSGAAAPGAKLILVVPENGSTVGGVFSAASYIVDQNLAPIVTSSYGLCELSLGQSENAQINLIWQQGATQGMSIFASAGDEGSAGCSNRDSGVADTDGLQVNGIASSPYVTAVGGTDFAWNWEAQGFETNWNTSNDAHGASAKGYIPEFPWNVSCANPLLQSLYFVESGSPVYATSQAVCNAVADSAIFDPLLTVGGGSGGYSHCTNPSGTTGSTCAGGYQKPSWQAGTGVPADGKRDVPDVALFASYGWPAVPGTEPPAPLVIASEIMLCYSGSGHACAYDAYDDIVFQGNGGTSAATPYWAGILALVEQKQGGARQGLVNPTLYDLWSKENLSACNSATVKAGNSCIFYDISAALNNAQPCKAGSSPDCATLSGTTPKYGILSGYQSTVGYDQATGLGSVNITNLVDGWSSSAPSPTLSLSASSLAFGSVVVGTTSAAQSITLKNTGAVAVTLTGGGITLSGGESDDFALTNGCGSSLAVGASCTLSAVFKPMATGAKHTEISIADNAAGSPQTVALTGTGVASSGTPAVSLSATALAFPTQTLGTASTTQTVTLTNSGSASLTFTSIVLRGGESDDFALTNGCGSSLAAGAHCTLAVVFKPLATGAKHTDISISDNAAGSPQTVTLTGTGATSAGTPAVSLSTTALSFPTQAPGTASASQALTVTNSGSAGLTFTSIVLRGGESDDFVLTNGCGPSLAAGAHCTLSVVFKPVAAGGKHTDISIADNAAGSPQTVTLTGTGG